MTDVASPELANRLSELVAEAVGGARMVAAEPADRPALIQAMIPFDDQPIEVADEVAAAAVVWLTGRRGRWHETGPTED